MSIACVRDKITKGLVEQSSTAIFEGGHVRFLNEVHKRFFVLRNDLRNTGDIAIKDLEIEGSCQ